MKKLNKLASVILAASVALVSCEKDPKTTTPDQIQGIVVSSNITENTTWTKGEQYVLTNRVAVEAGVTLTIEPGALIKGLAGEGANATALVIARGATIIADGTEQEPIIFTSYADQIAPGMTVSPNLSADLSGLWGGLIILGNAHASIKGGNLEASIEGIPASDNNGKYGGTNDADSSGVLRYVSVRHGGANIGEGNEINGITLGGVGSGTVIENIEVVANQDDGIEWFGGTVNVTNAVVWNAGDDAIDTDQAWAGTLDNFVVINPGDEGFELDGPEAAYTSTGHTIINGTLYADGASGLVDLDDNTDVRMSAIYFTNLSEGQDVEGYGPNAEKEEVGFSVNTNGYFIAGWEATLPEGKVLGDFFKQGSDQATVEVATRKNAGANSAMMSWTWAGQAGMLN
ncbi:hypothetical protein [Luteibaculum oceani]|uniref:T9SS C-terminal target domain-containing protein n=1 Tax=Luteibaculum oceani TaxID=1294296 RepID=A0A5C6V090_9FLAO|nr:hypothetical protein [Luteibaculum oceani]TXC78917.1 hypothetical protein FRX97_06800 [Luteibaculum oceani]